MKKTVSLAIVLLFFVSLAGYAQPITLRMETRSVARMEIVVMPFHAARDSAFAGELPKTLRDIVNGDLGYCGYFNVIEPEDLPPDTLVKVKRVGKTYDTLRVFTGSTAARVHGSVTVEWNGVTAGIAIFQPPIKDPIHIKDFRFKADDLRAAGHEIATWITRMVTGEEGAFTSKIVFVVKTGDNKNLWIMDWDGSNPRSLTQDRTLNMSPTWAPDGKTLYFTSFRDGNADVFRYDLPTGKVTSFVATPRVDSAPCVSSDGEWIVYSSAVDGNSEIYRIRPDRSDRTQLTISWGVDTSPSWSPTGRELVFTSDRTGTPQIYRMDFDGANVRRLTWNANYNETARWSPRGDLVAFASREIGFQVFTISPDGSGERRVTGEGSNFDPCWSPDGMKIVYTSVCGGQSSIYTCNWDGSNHRQLSFGLNASQPQWGPAVPLTERSD
ncbi:Tol-Pal system beta propeller repeat protein TolB [bacterium]|nr:Tol-Pal system beta propeller repeat protein TolB [bacterium]MBU1985239.1 Tol-Pal system beta propeller repeat protein TolB [bacterium]